MNSSSINTAVPQRKSKMRRAFPAIGLGIVVCLLGGGYLFYRNVFYNQETFPDPNGYDLIAQAALQASDVLEDAEKLSDAELQLYLAKNADVLDLMREGLAKPTAVTVRFNCEWIEQQMATHMGIRKLGHVLAIESALHRRQGHMDQATSSAVDLVRLGHVAGHRGLLINYLIGTACELQGLSLVTNMCLQLNQEQCRTIIVALEEMDRQREPMESMLRRERQWAASSCGFKGYLEAVIRCRSLTPGEQEIGESMRLIQSRLRTIRLARIALAAQDFLLVKGRPPKNVAELTPDFLRFIPLDPETGKPLDLSVPNKENDEWGFLLWMIDRIKQ